MKDADNVAVSRRIKALQAVAIQTVTHSSSNPVQPGLTIGERQRPNSTHHPCSPLYSIVMQHFNKTISCRDLLLAILP